MAFSHTNQGPGTPGRKARRSWFDTPPLTNLDPLPASGQHASKRRSLDVVETLTLTHFTNPPRITFGKAVIGKTKFRTLLLRNPHDFEQEVIVERFPYKKKFMVNETRFTVGPESTCSLEITWSPEEAGGYREMVQFYINEVYRLQAFLIGTADKPKPQRKIRKFPLGPCVRHPSTVVQTSALSNIRTSYSPNSKQVARELMEDMQASLQSGLEDKENSGNKRHDSHGAGEIQEGGVLKLSEVPPVNETVNATAPLNPRKMQVKAAAEEDGFKTPTPLESTAILGKQETGRECGKNRRQWRNISDITSPTLNMSPIPVNEGTEHGMTVDSYYQPNEPCNPALAKADKLSEVGRSKHVKRNLIQRMSPKDTEQDLKDTFVIPLAPAKSTKVASNLNAADNRIFTVAGSGAAVSTAQQLLQQQTAKADETRIIKVNETLLKTPCSMEDGSALSEQLTSEPVGSSAERSSNLNKNHRDVNKHSDMSPPKMPRDNSLFDPSQISPRTLLDESLSLISQVKMPLRGAAVYPEDKCPSINSSLISQGQGTVSPNSFMEDMRSMMHSSHCGSDDQRKNTSTPNIPSPSLIINSSIPHNIMVNHLECVRLSLHDSPTTASSERGTPRKLHKSMAATRRSITSQFQKEEKKRIATVANVFKKDQQLMGDGHKHVTNKFNFSKTQALTTKSNGRAHNLNTTGSPKRETFLQKKKEAEGRKAVMRSPLGKKSVLRRSPPIRRSPLSSPQGFDLKRAKNKQGKRKSSPLKPVGRMSQVKKSPSRNSDPIMPEIMSKIKANMMMMARDGSDVWNIVTPQKDVPLPGPHNPETNYFRNLLPAESKETDETIKENTGAKKIKLFPDLRESDCYENDEECLIVKNKETKVTVSDMDRNTDDDDATDADKTREQEVACKTELEHKLCVSESTMTKRYSKCQAESVVTEASRALSAQRFYTLSPSNLPTSPEFYLDQSRRGTITVTKSRPSDALLTAINNRKRLFQDSPQKTPHSITDDDRETQENISVKFEERYQEIDGKIYIIVKETTDVVKSTTETYIEEMPISPQQFDTPVKLPNSPDLLVSRRSTHVVRSPKVINFDAMNRRQLNFVDEVEGSVVGNDESMNLINEKSLGNEKELNSSELSEDNCSVIKSDTFEKEPSLHITADRHDIFTDSSAPAITSVCAISRRLVNYDDGSETCSTANVTKDSLDTSHSIDSLGCSFSEAQASLEEKRPTDDKQIDKEDMPFAMDSDDSIIQLNWEVITKAEPDVSVMLESDQRNEQDLENICRRNDKHLAAADEESEDEQFYDTMSDKYYDAMSDAGNPEVDQIDELKQTAMSSKSLESITSEPGKYSADSCFGIFRSYHCEAEERPECSVLIAVPSMDTCVPSMDTFVPLADANATMPAHFDALTVRAEVSIDHREMFEVVDRKVINLCSAAELQPVDEVVRSTPEAKARRKLRRSASACDLLEHQHDACDLLDDRHVLDEAESQNVFVPKTTTPRKLMTSSKSAVFRNCEQVLAKFSPKNVSKGQSPSSTATQVMVKRRSQSMFNLARQAERGGAVRTEHTTINRAVRTEHTTTNRAVRTEHTTTNRAVRTEHTTTNRAARQASQVSQPTSKQKSTKGVAQSKLFLVKKSKTVAPRHPMLYAAKNMYYDERWMEKQERGFMQWLNFVLTPPEEYMAVVNKAKVDARSLSLEVEHVTPRLAPTKEILSFRAYTARRRLNRLRRGACQLYQSDAVVNVIRKIEVEVESRRISARRDKMMHADVGIKQKLLDLLLHYSPLWLRIGLETIFGEVLMLQSNEDVMGLSRFILTRLLASPDIAAEFAHPTVPHLYKEGFMDSVSRHTVKKFLLLVYFLDQAKLGHLIDYDPCLFCKDAGIKSSKEILIEFSREVLSGEGDITRHLAYFGCTVSHSQKPIDEFDFAVSNLSSDLRDGLRLCRVLEFLAGDHNIMAKLRTPAISRLQKIHNTELFFKAVHERGLDFHLVPDTVTARDVVDGHREKTLSLLWQLIIHFQSSVLVNETHLREEIDILMKSLRLKIAMQKIGALSMEDCQARRDSGETKLLTENQRLHLIFQWCRLVCLHYGLQVENFTVSFSDGRALCCLLHHYQPAMLHLAEIRFETTISLQESAVDKYQQDLDDSTNTGISLGDSDENENNPEVFERLLANEKSNFKTLYEKTSALGGVPLMLKSADMSNTIPDERVVSTFVSYLCARLLDIREEVKAARIIQMAWRKKQLRRAFLEKQRKTKAAVTIQQWFRSVLAKHKKAREIEHLAAAHIQAAWRGLAARLYVGQLKQMIQEGDQENHRELSDVTSKCLRPWQSELIQHYHMILLKQQKQQECIRRREEAAAITIQKHVRRFRCLQEFTKQQESVIRIQALWRRQLAKKILCALKQEKIENSAVVIQKWMKRHFCSNQYWKKRNAAISLQKCWRMRQSRRTLQSLRAESLSRAATTIQKCWRMRQSRRTLQALRAESLSRAATTIQKCWRMRQSRRTLQALRAERLSRAATTIQKHVRARLVHQKFQNMKLAAVVVQGHWRMKQAKRELAMLKSERDNKAAIILQNYMKSIICRHKYIILRNATMLLQRSWRKTIARRKLITLKTETDNNAAVVIQKYFKRYKAQQQYRAQQKSIVLIQSTWRMLQAKKELLSLKQKQQELSATLIQCYYRRFRCRQEFQKYRNAAITVQKTWRMHCAKNMLRKLQLENQIQAVIKIQNIYRGFIQRRRYIQLKLSAVIVQKWWRMILAKKLYNRLRQQRQENAALILQRNFKMWKHRSYFLKLKSATVVLQTAWKMVRDRRLLVTLKSIKQERSALCIQKVWRGHVTRQVLASKRRAASVIQSWWKMIRIKQQYWCIKEAALLIQAWYRAAVECRHQRSVFLNQRASAILIQSWYRAAVECRHQRSVFLNQRASAIHIQSWYRAAVECRHQRSVFLDQRASAIHIQSWYRAAVECRHQRSVFLNQRASAIHIQSWWRSIVLQQKFQIMRHSAVIIQSHYRRFQCRRKFLAVKEATVVIQHHYRSHIRGLEVRKEYLTMQRAAVTIQNRGYLQRRHEKQQAAALVLQATFRKIRAHRKYTEQKQATETIQKYFREYQKARTARQQFLHQKQAAQTIQKYFREYQKARTARQQFLHQKQAAQTIQKYFREYQKARTARQQFLHQKQAASIIQTTYRAFLVRKQYLHTHQSVIKIQAHIRGWIMRRQFQKLKHAAVTIQVHFRAVQLSKFYREAFLQLKTSAIIIQRCYRSAVVKRKALKDKALRHAAATRIQAVYRGWRQSSKYLLLQAAAMMIQRWYRSCLAGSAVRTEIVRMEQAACVIQKRFRLYKLVQEAKRQIRDLRNEKEGEIIRKLEEEEEKCDIGRGVSVTNDEVQEEKRHIQELRNEYECEIIRKLEEEEETCNIERGMSLTIDEVQEEKRHIQELRNENECEIIRKLEEEEECDIKREMSLTYDDVQESMRQIQDLRTEEESEIIRKLEEEETSNIKRGVTVANTEVQEATRQIQDLRMEEEREIRKLEEEEDKCNIKRGVSVHNDEVQEAKRQIEALRTEKPNEIVRKQEASKCDIKTEVSVANTGVDRKTEVSVANTGVDRKTEETMANTGVGRKTEETMANTGVGRKTEETMANTGVDRKTEVSVANTGVDRKTGETMANTGVGRKTEETMANTGVDRKTEVSVANTGVARKTEETMANTGVDRKTEVSVANTGVDRKTEVSVANTGVDRKTEVSVANTGVDRKTEVSVANTGVDRKTEVSVANTGVDRKTEVSVANTGVDRKTEVSVANTGVDRKTEVSVANTGVDRKTEVSVANTGVDRKTEEPRRGHAAIVAQKIVRGHQSPGRVQQQRGASQSPCRVQQQRGASQSPGRVQQQLGASQSPGRVQQQLGASQSPCRVQQQLGASQSPGRVQQQRGASQSPGRVQQQLGASQSPGRVQQQRGASQSPGRVQQQLGASQSPCGVQQQLDASQSPCRVQQQRGASQSPCRVQQQLGASQSPCRVQQQLGASQSPCRVQQQLGASQSPCRVQQQLGASQSPCRVQQQLGASQSPGRVQQLGASQSPCRVQQQLGASPDFEASDAEKEFMEMRWQLLGKEEALGTQSSCRAYQSCEAETRHVTDIAINCTDQNVKDISRQQQNASAVVIQRAVRRYICRKKTIKIQCIVMIQANIRQFLARRDLLARLRSVVMLQTAVRGWLARRSTAALRKRHSATVCLQAHLRGYLVRKTFSTLLREKIQSVWKQKKEQGAAIKIQAKWRGFVTRRNINNRKLAQARKRLKEANRQATEEKTLGSRTSSALDFLLREKDVGHILEALMHLEVCTRLSPVCCERMAEVNAVPGLYRLISSCNRSVPHMELIKYSLSILLNLAKYEKTIAAVLEPQSCVATILELLLIYREKGAIFNYCCMLLGILGLHPERRAVILKHPLIIDRLQSIHALTLRKHRMNQSRQVMQAKMAALRSFNCTLPALTPSKCKLRRIKPEWALARDSIKDFDDPVAAVTFVMDSLQIGPKI